MLPTVENYYVGEGLQCPDCGQASLNLIVGYYDEQVIMLFCPRCHRYRTPLPSPEDVDAEERQMYAEMIS